MDPRVWASAQDFGTFVLIAYAQKPVLLKFVREYGGRGRCASLYIGSLVSQGGTLIFSYIRRLGSFIGVQNFEF